VEHSCRTKDFFKTRDPLYSRQHKEMIGYVKDCRGNVLKKIENEENDYLEIDLLVKAACLSLDEPSDVFDETNKTLRERGTQLEVMIEYLDVQDFMGKEDFSYTYTVTRIPKTQYKVDSLINVGSKQLIRTRYGLYLSFSQKGYVERVDFLHIFSLLGSIAGLFSVAGTIVYFIAITFFAYGEAFEHAVKVNELNNKEKDEQTKTSSKSRDSISKKND